MKQRTHKESAIVTRYIMMPEHTNQHGTAFGGIIMSWIDIAAAMAAEKHCAHEAVTASIDEISLLAPVYVGDHVILKAAVNYVGNTSMEIGVQVKKENPYTGEKIKIAKAYLTFVGLDKNKRPTKIPQIIAETEDEKRRYENAKIRVLNRKEMLKKIKQKN